MSQGRGRRGWPVLLKVVVAVSVHAAVGHQQLGSHRQTGHVTGKASIKVANGSWVSKMWHAPALLRTKAQDFGALGTFWALGPPVGAQLGFSVGLLLGRGLQGPHWAQTKGPAVVTGTDCEQTGASC